MSVGRDYCGKLFVRVGSCWEERCDIGITELGVLKLYLPVGLLGYLRLPTS